MLPSERTSIARRVVTHLTSVSPEFRGLTLGPIVTSRIAAVITAIDAVTVAANPPLLIADLLPGIDLVVARDYAPPTTCTAALVSNETSYLNSIWDERSISSEWIDVLTELATGALSRAGSVDDGPAVGYHRGLDGLHYFLFESTARIAALAQFDVADAVV